jgi:hypothetical protein
MLQQAEEIHKLNPQSMYAFSFHVVSWRVQTSSVLSIKFCQLLC